MSREDYGPSLRDQGIGPDLLECGEWLGAASVEIHCDGPVGHIGSHSAWLDGRRIYWPFPDYRLIVREIEDCIRLAAKLGNDAFDVVEGRGLAVMRETLFRKLGQ